MTHNSILLSVISQLECYSGIQAIVLTAHPDDEILFFGPLLQYLEEHNTSTLVLCLTTGGWRSSAKAHEGSKQDPSQGALRVSELTSLSKKFSYIRTHQLRTPLLDDPCTFWDKDLLQIILYGMNIALGDTITVYTFDEKGATGHINHCQIGLAVLEYRLNARCYVLQTPSRLSWVIPYLYRARKNQLQIVSRSPRQLRSLFLTTYASQDVWFRRLFLIFAPYMHSNIFSAI